MSTLGAAFLLALRLLGGQEPALAAYASRSFGVALCATALAACAGLPLGVMLAELEFRGKRAVVTVLNALLAVPTVVVGLTVYAFLSRQGPLGTLGLLFTVPGMIVGEVVLILPLIAALSMAAVARVDAGLRRTALSLGASPSQVLRAVLRASRFGLLAAIIAAFGRVLGEVGVATIIGGNAEAFTRTLTTAIVLEVDMGRFEVALALGIVLLILSLGVNVLLQIAQGGSRR